MSARDDLWDYIGDRTVSREELFGEFTPEVRKPLSRMCLLGELIREGDDYRRGERWFGAFRPWGEDELAVIRRYVDDGYDALAERLPGRSRVAIKGKANDMGVSPVARVMTVERAWATTRMPVFTVGHLSPIVRGCIAEAA